MRKEKAFNDMITIIEYEGSKNWQTFPLFGIMSSNLAQDLKDKKFDLIISNYADENLRAWVCNLIHPSGHSQI